MDQQDVSQPKESKDSSPKNLSLNSGLFYSAEGETVAEGLRSYRSPTDKIVLDSARTLSEEFPKLPARQPSELRAQLNLAEIRSRLQRKGDDSTPNKENDGVVSPLTNTSIPSNQTAVSSLFGHHRGFPRSNPSLFAEKPAGSPPPTASPLEEPASMYREEHNSTFRREEPSYREEHNSTFRREEPSYREEHNSTFRREEPSYREEHNSALRREEPSYREEHNSTLRREEPSHREQHNSTLRREEPSEEFRGDEQEGTVRTRPSSRSSLRPDAKKRPLTVPKEFNFATSYRPRSRKPDTRNSVVGVPPKKEHATPSFPYEGRRTSMNMPRRIVSQDVPCAPRPETAAELRLPIQRSLSRASDVGAGSHRRSHSLTSYTPQGPRLHTAQRACFSKQRKVAANLPPVPPKWRI